MTLINFQALDPVANTNKILACQNVPLLKNCIVLCTVRVAQLNASLPCADAHFQEEIEHDKKLTIALMELSKQRIKHLSNKN